MKILSLLTTIIIFPANSALASPAEGALAALKSLDYRYFVAGGTCAAFSHGITTPIDVVKTKIQAEPEKYQKGMRQAALDIIKTDGPGALLAGLGPTVVGYGVEGAMKIFFLSSSHALCIIFFVVFPCRVLSINVCHVPPLTPTGAQFGVYEVMKPVFASLLSSGGDGSNKAVAFLLASVVAGAVAALLLCPMESTRIKMVTDPVYAKDNLLSALARLAATEGLGSSFGGLWAMLSKQVPYTFGKQVSFDVFAGFLYVFLGSLKLSDGAVKWGVSIFAAAGASLIACIFSQPGDMILTETYKPKNAQADPVVEAFEIAPADLTEQVSTEAQDDGSVSTETSSVASMANTVVTESSSEMPSTTSYSDMGAGTTTYSTNPETGTEASASFSNPPTVTQEQPPTAVSYTKAPEPAQVSTAFRDVVTRLYRDGGVAKFFTGTQARIIHVGLIITSQLVIYDIVKQLLGLPATGSH
eukprot:scaffold3058_cov177-Amphora_coffeaeformis.AAC.13